MTLWKCGQTLVLVVGFALAAGAQSSSNSGASDSDQAPVLSRRTAAVAQVTQGPTIQYADDQFAVVTWTTDVASASKIYFGTDPNKLERTAEGGSSGTSHRVGLKDLQPSTTYYFRVETNQAAAPAMASFQTVPSGAAPLQSQPAKRLQQGVTITSGPTIQYADETSAVITWSTKQPVPSKLYYGTSSNALTQTAEAPGMNTYHRAHLANLQPNAAYYFQVDTGQGTRAQQQSFRTVASGAQPVFDQKPDQSTQAAVSNPGSAPAQASAPATPHLLVPAGTEIEATLQEALSTKTAKVGDKFSAVVSKPVKANNGQVAIPAGSTINGEIIEAEQGKTLPMVRGRGRLNLRFRDITLPSHTSFPLTATLASIHGQNPNSEGEVESKTSGKTAAKDVGIGAGAGTIAGLILGSAWKGLVIGAIAGGGYVLATKGKDVELPAKSGMRVKLDQELSVPVAAVNQVSQNSSSR